MKLMTSLFAKLSIPAMLAWCLALAVRMTGAAPGGSLPERRVPGSSGLTPRAAGLTLPAHGEPPRPGWGRPAPEKMPRPTYWPMVFGLGVAFFMWGLISNLFVLGLGFTLFVVSCAGWVYDLLDEFKA